MTKHAARHPFGFIHWPPRCPPTSHFSPPTSPRHLPPHLLLPIMHAAALLKAERPPREIKDEMSMSDDGGLIVPPPFLVRPANALDIEALAAIDHQARTSSQRREFIMRSVATGLCSVLVTPDGPTA